MINMDEINAEIAALEAGKTTYATCERLSILYNVRNNLEPDKAPNTKNSILFLCIRARI